MAEALLPLLPPAWLSERPAFKVGHIQLENRSAKRRQAAPLYGDGGKRVRASRAIMRGRELVQLYHPLQRALSRISYEFHRSILFLSHQKRMESMNVIRRPLPRLNEIEIFK